MFKQLASHIASIRARDPAARSAIEVALCYPGLHAVLLHRVAHGLWARGWYLPARMLSQFGRWLTAIEIHPAARIGQRLFIDHGHGTVIGETADIGDDVTLYHGVTLGGMSLERGVKRHPTVCDGAIVGAGAQVLGPIRVGNAARIGANAVVVADVPNCATVVGIPAHMVDRAPVRPADQPFAAYGTPVSGTVADDEASLAALAARIAALEAELARDNGQRMAAGGRPNSCP